MDLLEFELENENYIYLNGTANFIFKWDQVNPFFFGRINIPRILFSMEKKSVNFKFKE